MVIIYGHESKGKNFPKRKTLCLYIHSNNCHPISFPICQLSAQITNGIHLTPISLVKPSLHASSVPKYTVASHLQGLTLVG